MTAAATLPTHAGTAGITRPTLTGTNRRMTAAATLPTRTSSTGITRPTLTGTNRRMTAAATLPTRSGSAACPAGQRRGGGDGRRRRLGGPGRSRRPARDRRWRRPSRGGAERFDGIVVGAGGHPAGLARAGLAAGRRPGRSPRAAPSRCAGRPASRFPPARRARAPPARDGHDRTAGPCGPRPRCAGRPRHRAVSRLFLSGGVAAVDASAGDGGTGGAWLRRRALTHQRPEHHPPRGRLARPERPRWPLTSRPGGRPAARPRTIRRSRGTRSRTARSAPCSVGT